tara:strand:+ start:275 stop:781 length:507 start_codon:yes stop_codon:yes gene_type:complete
MIVSPQIVVQSTEEEKRPAMGSVGCVLILISLALPYVGDFWRGYEMLELYRDIASFLDVEDIGAIMESLASGSTGGGDGGGESPSLGTIGFFMFLGLPIWNCLIAIPSLLGAGSKKAVKNMKSSGTLHFLYSMIMLVCCFLTWEELIFDVIGYGVWVSIVGGILMTLD